MNKDKIKQEYQDAVDKFSRIKVNELMRNIHKGKREDWKDVNQFSKGFFIEEMDRRTILLAEAIENENYEEMKRQCANISNFAMFIADQENLLEEQ